MNIAKAIFGIVTTFILMPLWISVCCAIPYRTGKAINKLFFRGREILFSISGIIYALGLCGFLPLFLLLSVHSITQVFNKSFSEGWYKSMFPLAAIGNTISIVCFLIYGVCGRKFFK